MKRYPAYKDSGVEWLGEIPEGWETGRLGHVASVVVSNVDKHSEDGEVPIRLCNYVDVYKNDVVRDGLDFMEATATAEQIVRFGLRRGDTAFTKDSETADDIGVPAFVDADGLVCGYHLAVARPISPLADSKFLFYVLKSSPSAKQWYLAASGVTRVGLRSADIPKLRTARPPLAEQRVIAAYLDRETAQIDELIGEQEALIGSLTERRQSVSSAMFQERIGVGERLCWSFSEIDDRAGVRWEYLPLMSVSISWGVRVRSEMTADVAKADDLSNYKICEPGDIVINRMRAFQGALGVSPVPGVVSPDYAVIRTSAVVDPIWLELVMRSSSFVSEMSSRIRGIGSVESGAVRTPRISVTDLGHIRLAVPSLEDQRVQSASLFKQTSAIDSLIDECRELIALLKERRSALISAAVTGKIDVRDVVSTDSPSEVSLTTIVDTSTQ
ncbi:MAG: restriction endonuclease subunit S [Actinomycetota bacterium]|nr:restriction endonuclease subunit S [Actinomycetota bacterium]